MTRAGIKLKKEGEEDLYYYQHCDGYPTGLLVDLIHDLKHLDNYDKIRTYLENNYREVGNYPGDIEYSYVIDMDKGKIYTYSDKESKLLRIDTIDAGEIELEYKD